MRKIQSSEEESRGPILNSEEDLRQRLVSYARQLMYGTRWRAGDRDLEAEDLVQEALLRSHQAEAGGAAIQNRESWLRSVVRRIWIDRQRLQLLDRMTIMPEAGSAEEPKDPFTSPELLAIEGERKEILRQAIDGLPVRKREVILKYLEGWSPQEIAILLDSNPGAVRTNLCKAISRLQRSLGAKARQNVTVDGL